MSQLSSKPTLAEVDRYIQEMQDLVAGGEENVKEFDPDTAVSGGIPHAVCSLL